MKDSLRTNKTALIIDSSEFDYSYIIDLFKKNQINIKRINSGLEVFDNISTLQAEIIFCELLLKDIEGIELCQQLREKGFKQTFIFFTDNNDDLSQIIALNTGADDYILKSTKATVLLARAESFLRKTNPNSFANKKSNSTFIIDRERYLLIKEGKEIILPRKEFELLSLLYSSPKKVFSRKEISKIIWGEESLFRNRTIDVHIRKLREKIGERYIKTMKGVGYSFDL